MPDGGLKRIFLSPPFVGAEEREAVACAFDSGYVAPCGPQVEAFEKALAVLTGAAATAVASGTAALDLLMRELEVGPGDVVIAPSLTFIATVGPATQRGAKCVFVDSDAATGDVSLSELENALKDHPHAKCVFGVDIYGQCCDYDALEALCARYQVPLIIDAAESVGATYKGRPAGTAGIAGIYSFNGNKIITTSGGGAVISRNAELVQRASWRAQQSREKEVYYEHREVGMNYRMSNMLGALGCAQLAKLPTILAAKRRIAAFYNERFPALKSFPCVDRAGSNNWLNVKLFDSQAERDEMMERLSAQNIESRPVWKPMHLQPAFAEAKYYGGNVAEDLFNRGLCLPSGAGLTDDDLERIAEVMR